MSPLLLAALALTLCVVLFAVCYVFARRIDNYGVVDVLWSLAFAPVVLLYAGLGAGWGPRRALVGAVGVVWSLRLGLYLWRRVAAHHPIEDGRYADLRARWAGRLGPEMFRFYQLQAASVVVLSAPFLLALARAEPSFTLVDGLALALVLAGQIGESIADAQLARFKRERGGAGRVCDRGLWAVSRHPNYFFVCVTWLGFAVFALPAPFGWLGLIAPASMLYLLLRVTGVPLTEAQALRTKGDAYRDYQRRVSVFVPWFPRR